MFFLIASRYGGWYRENSSEHVGVGAWEVLSILEEMMFERDRVRFGAVDRTQRTSGERVRGRVSSYVARTPPWQRMQLRQELAVTDLQFQVLVGFGGGDILRSRGLGQGGIV